MKYVKMFSIVLIFILLSFRGEINYLQTIDIEDAFNKAQEIVLNDFVESLEYIVLKSEKPVGGNLRVYSSGNNLICIAKNQIFVFDRRTGIFIREIGSFGNGPGEYHIPLYFDSQVQHIIASKGDRFL